MRLDPIRVLFWSAVFNGVTAAPLVFAIMTIASNPKVMGRWEGLVRRPRVGLADVCPHGPGRHREIHLLEATIAAPSCERAPAQRRARK
jgi:hypothetical protein